MQSISRVALIGFGEVGQHVAGDFAKAGIAGLAVYDVLFADVRSAPSCAATKLHVKSCASVGEAVKDADLVLCAVTAANDREAAQSAAPYIRQGAFFLDVNSVSPNTKREAAHIIESADGNYVEAAVMTPIAPNGIASSMLLGGPHAADFLALAALLGFRGAKVFSSEIGKASATKLCRSVIIKGMEALVSESMLAAREYGVEKTVLASLSDLLPLPDWDRTARYLIGRALEHGVRRAEEMREAAVTVADAGIEPLMAEATAKRQDWTASRKAALQNDSELGALLDAIRDIGRDASKTIRGKTEAA